MEVPMLNEEQYAKAYELYGEAIRDINREGGRLVRFKPLLDYYKEVTGWDETEPNAIMHHRIAQYGPPCESAENLIERSKHPSVLRVDIKELKSA